MSQGNLVFQTPPTHVPDQYTPDALRKIHEYLRHVVDQTATWAEITDKPTRVQFVVSDFTESGTYTLTGTTTDVEEVRDFLLGLTIALQKKGIIRSVPQEG